MDDSPAVSAWLRDLEARYLERLTPREVARALRALSSCYVERREALARGGALDGDGKRAAFALFYAPLHFLTVRRIVEALGADRGIGRILDLGCGTGAAGAAWALTAHADAIAGVDLSGWAVAEASRAYRVLGVPGRAARGNAVRTLLRERPSRALLAAYLVNEVTPAERQQMLTRLLALGGDGWPALVVEPIARRLSPWWDDWAAAWVAAGGRADEWRFPAAIPDLQRRLADAAGLDLRELTARSLYLPRRVA